MNTQVERLHAIVCEVFTDAELTQILKFRMEQDLDALTARGTLRERAFALIQWAQRNNRLAELAEVLAGERQGRDDLHRIATELNNTTDAAQSHQSGESSPQIVPQGLGRFTSEDQDFYPRLLPPPYRPDGLPESIGIWLRALETRDKSFRIGVLYGPSGCGKSSMVKAGLIPRLADHVVPVYIEASATNTEDALRAQLTRSTAAEPVGDLAEFLRRVIATDQAHGLKTVLVIDQFEQWLHSHLRDRDTELVRALRTCDGITLQAMLLVRDDFWAPISRLIEDFELNPKEEFFSKFFDRFDREHAQAVLAEFGDAYNRLPSRNIERLSRVQQDFLQEAVDLLAERDGSVSPLRISLFALMMKEKEWNRSQLEPGFKSLGATFLRRQFDPPHGRPKLEFYRAGVIAMLKMLLPARGTNITDALQSKEALRQAFVQQPVGDFFSTPLRSRPAEVQVTEFETVVGMLDHELRLITPTDRTEAPRTEAPAHAGDACQWYKLTHDFLVPSLREWIVQDMQLSWHGRAIVELQQLSESWSLENDARYLPEWHEHILIEAALPVRRHETTHTESAMLWSARKRHGQQLGLLILVVLFFATAGWYWHGTVHAQSLMSGMSDSAALIHSRQEELRQYSRWLLPRLQELISNSEKDKRPAWRPHLALLMIDERNPAPHIGPVYDAMLAADWSDFAVLRDALHNNKSAVLPDLWSDFRKRSSTTSLTYDDRRTQLRAGLAAVAFSPDDERWNREDWAFLALSLVQVSADEAATVRALLKPASASIQEFLASIVRDPAPHLDGQSLPEEIPGIWRALAVEALIDYCGDDIGLLCDCACSTRIPSRFQRLLDKVKEVPDAAVIELKRIVNESPDSVGEAAAPGDRDRARIQLGQRRARAAIALLLLGHPNSLEAALAAAPVFQVAGDPEAQTQFIHLHSLYGFKGPNLFHLYKQYFHRDKAIDDPQGHARYALLSDSTTEVTLEKLDKECLAQSRSRESDWIVRDVLGWPRTFVRFNPGTFEMGTPTDAFRRHADWNNPVKATDIDHAFALCIHEVTRSEIVAYLEDIKSDPVERRFVMALSPYSHEPNAAIGRIRWFDAINFCRWLTFRSGLDESDQCYEPVDKSDRPIQTENHIVKRVDEWKLLDGYKMRKGYRLPTEKEWEYACRASTTTLYGFGSDQSLTHHYAWFLENRNDNNAKPVATKIPNLRGLFDTHGNMLEWCQDRFNEDRQDDDGYRRRVLRGGGWEEPDFKCRSAWRYRYFADTEHNGFGFRLAMSVLSEQ